MRSIIFAGGGTGGHLFPGLAVAQQVRSQNSAVSIRFLTSDRRLDRQLLGDTAFEQQVQPIKPFTSRPWHWPAFWQAWRQSVRQARDAFAVDRPAAVLGLGGFAAGPAVVAAAQVGISTGLLNPDVLPGRANRYLARRADRVFLQWEAAARHLPAGVAVETVGCPIRPEFATADAAAGRAQFQLPADRPVLLVTGASQGARTINQALCRAWPQFLKGHPEWQLLHLTGPLDEEACRAAYAAAGVAAQVRAFTNDMAQALAAADVVVSRAGASTLAELTTLGKPSILLPYPYHRDQHQAANAAVLADGGAALVLEDTRDAATNAPAVLSGLESLADPERRARMAASARALARPDAAERVADWLLAQSAHSPG